MINFTVGPVQSPAQVCEVGGQQVPYFRTPEFSSIMLENEQMIKKYTNAGPDARVVFLTGSGTASMEAAIMHAFDSTDRVLVVNGGSFGQRFVELCQIHQVPYTEISLDAGKKLSAAHLSPFENAGYTGFVVNLHETSTGVLYDLELISSFCQRNGLFLVVDAISAFLADDVDFSRHHIDILLTGSQKALACHPGISLLVLSGRSVKRIENRPTKCMYLDLKRALLDGQRGQTPFTPAVNILLQIHARLKQIETSGGVSAQIKKTAELAADFRQGIRDLPLQIMSESLSNAVTPLHPTGASAYDIFTILKDEYGIWVCPNGGALAQTLFRVGHIGALTKEDNAALIDALKDMHLRGLL